MTRSLLRQLLLLVSLALPPAFPVHAHEEPLEQARRLLEQSQAMLQEKKFVEGMPLAKQAFEIREQLLGSQHLDTAAALLNLANFYTTNRVQTDIEALYRRVLALRERALGLEHPDTATALNSLANYYRRNNKLHPAEPLYVRALRIRESAFGAEHPETSGVITNLGNLYLELGDYRRAAPLLERAVAINQKVFGPEHPRTLLALNDLAIVYGERGEYAKEAQLVQSVLALREKVSGPNHPDTARAIENLAMLYKVQGDYARAEPLYARALAIFEQAFGPTHAEIALTLDNLAALYVATGAHDKAEALYRRSLAVREAAYGTQSPLFAFTLENLGVLYGLQRKYAQAEPLLVQALAIRQKSLGEHPEVANNLAQLATLYGAMGSYPQAERALEQALALRTKVSGSDHPSTASKIASLARLYRKQGKDAQAEPLYRRALAIRERSLGGKHPLVAELLDQLAMIDWVRGKASAALPLLERSQRITAASAERFLFSGSEARNTEFLTSLQDHVATYATFSATVPGAPSATLGLNNILQYKSRVADVAADAAGRLRSGLRPQQQAAFERLAELANQLSTLTYRGLGALSPEAYRKRVAELTREQDVLETALARQSSEFRSRLRPVSVAAVRAALPLEAALVEWFRYEPIDLRGSEQPLAPRYVAYVLKPAASPVAIDLGPAPALEELARELRLAASSPERGDVRARAAALSDLLIAPLRKHLQGVRHLLLAPDGALNLVPMAALLDAQGRYLAERFEITYLTSGRDLLRIADAEPVLASNPVVVANPDYGRPQRLAANVAAGQRSADLDRGGLTFRALPGAGLEAVAITELLRGENARLLTGAAASEVNLKQLRGPQVLHLATHGFFLNDQQARSVSFGATKQLPGGFLAENPLLRSGLALAGANERRSGVSDDGILTALEASRLDLRGTELVVMSACETGIGEIRNGDGVSGLRRGLQLAGAQTQVTSLWKVADQPTKELMIDFYRNLVKGMGRSDALRRAQLAALANPQQAHPYFWASFVAVGDWKPISTAN